MSQRARVNALYVEGPNFISSTRTPLPPPKNDLGALTGVAPNQKFTKNNLVYDNVSNKHVKNKLINRVRKTTT